MRNDDLDRWVLDHVVVIGTIFLAAVFTAVALLAYTIWG